MVIYNVRPTADQRMVIYNAPWLIGQPDGPAD